MPDPDLRVGRFAAANTIDEVARVPILSVNQFFCDRFVPPVVNLVTELPSFLAWPAPDVHHAVRAVYSDSVLLPLHPVRVPDAHLEEDRLSAVIKRDVHRVGR